MNFKLNLLAAAALMAAASPALATMADGTSGNGELLVNLRFYTGDNNSGGDDISAVFDLGVDMNTFIANKNVAGFTQTFDLKAANYGSAWNDVMTFAGANTAAIEFNVIALDQLNDDLAGGARYLTTADVATYPALSNLNSVNLKFMNSYVTVNNSRGTHASQANGASTAVSSDVQNSYFGKVNGGSGDGDSWSGQTTADTTKTLATAQNFWFLTNSSTTNTQQATKSVFGYDLDGDGLFKAVNAEGKNEFGEWAFDVNAGKLTFSNPAPVPEASTYAMMLAGLGLVGFAARRRLQA